MTVAGLRKVLEYARSDDLEVKVITAEPTIGAKSFSKVKSAGYGFDWDSGLLIYTEDRLVPKKKEQDIFESAVDLLMSIATEGLIKKKNTYEHRTAQRILIRFGYTEEQLIKYVNLFHRDQAVIRGINKESL